MIFFHRAPLGARPTLALSLLFLCRERLIDMLISWDVLSNFSDIIIIIQVLQIDLRDSYRAVLLRLLHASVLCVLWSSDHHCCTYYGLRVIWRTHRWAIVRTFLRHLSSIEPRQVVIFIDRDLRLPRYSSLIHQWCYNCFLRRCLNNSATTMTMEAKLAFEVINSEDHLTWRQPIRTIDLLDDSHEGGNAQDALMYALQTIHWFINLRPEKLDCDIRAHLYRIDCQTCNILDWELTVWCELLSQVRLRIVQWLNQCLSETRV